MNEDNGIIPYTFLTGADRTGIRLAVLSKTF